MSDTTYSPPAAAKARGFFGTLTDLGVQLITAKTMAEIDRTRRPETITVYSPNSNQAGAMTTGRFSSLSDFQLAGLGFAGLLSVVLFANLVTG